MKKFATSFIVKGKEAYWRRFGSFLFSLLNIYQTHVNECDVPDSDNESVEDSMAIIDNVDRASPYLIRHNEKR
ncbi:MAG: hypothetical protein CMQ51_00640 [Gammaproteobacteria bacterium]|nr:hypothetical protein [Gammaproteobacteria bacterium]|tara:strand:+ start:508 stop:726 length:219 start_codon:yes stop_codon:yes gene_type:complete